MKERCCPTHRLAQRLAVQARASVALRLLERGAVARRPRGLPITAQQRDQTVGQSAPPARDVVSALVLPVLNVA